MGYKLEKLDMHIAVLQFVLKDKSSKDQLSNLSEAVDSYIADERPGYAEPSPGVQIYLCPPTSRMSEMLNKHMPEKHPETNISVENGLIGVVVWRRAHISKTISPNSSSNHKHTLKNQFYPLNRLQDDSSNVNVNTPIRPPHASVFNNVSYSKPEDNNNDDDDDIPPGFGPASKDDDLPEFNFSGDLNQSQNLLHGVKMTQRPVDTLRDLIKKYGKSGSSETSFVNKRGVVFNDDDDDDIPGVAYRPPQIHHQPCAVVHGHRPPVQRNGQPPLGGRWVERRFVYGARWRPQ
ncbi:hypothetical protein DH2020_036520 [Rehmannia glutinosa]|uniref:Spen paralogue and orthologue SPOC C-terminal domain-containing protein n=1 Tax=Rehmannia glutinosa TaxID=99300 RepID=A0ABR0V5Z4_REHGL